MRIKKSLLERIIKEEFANHVKSLLEAGDEKKSDEEKPEETEGDSEKKGPGRPPGSKNKPKTQDASQAAPADKKVPPPDEMEQEDELPDQPPEPHDPEDELDKEREDGEGDDDRGSGKVSDEVVGKRIQSITMEPKSKMVPGAMELVITFDEMPDPLKVIITKTGQVKFWFRGLHNGL